MYGTSSTVQLACDACDRRGALIAPARCRPPEPTAGGPRSHTHTPPRNPSTTVQQSISRPKGTPRKPRSQIFVAVLTPWIPWQEVQRSRAKMRKTTPGKPSSVFVKTLASSIPTCCSMLAATRRRGGARRRQATDLSCGRVGAVGIPAAAGATEYWASYLRSCLPCSRIERSSSTGQTTRARRCLTISCPSG